MKVFITWKDDLVEKMFINKGWTIARSFDESFDLICFPGGIDINPFLYGERPCKTDHFNTSRDNAEIKYWKRTESTVPKLGICRGAQLGNVLCGGTLWQDVTGHMSQHLVKDFAFTDNVKYRYPIVSSDHHQMCRITDDAILLAAAMTSSRKYSDGESKFYGTTSRNEWEDPEAFYYSNFNFLGIQFHPEYPKYNYCHEYFWDLLNECFDFEKVQAVQPGASGGSILEGKLCL